MLELELVNKGSDSFVVMCLGAHADDIEIGCGGTLLQLCGSIPTIKLCWVVFSASGDRCQEATRGVELFAGGCDKEVILKEYRDGFLPYSGGEIKEFFEDLKTRVNPDLIFTPWHDDAHQDHRLISELTWNTFRNHLIWEYEIPKYDGDLGRPNVFVPLQSSLHEYKVTYLFEAFQSQHSRPWFQRETFLGLMRIRGVESNSPSGYAEAFHVRKLVIGGIN